MFKTSILCFTEIFSAVTAALLMYSVSAYAEESLPETDVEVWNRGVDLYKSGNYTNALAVPNLQGPVGIDLAFMGGDFAGITGTHVVKVEFSVPSLNAGVVGIHAVKVSSSPPGQNHIPEPVRSLRFVRN